MRCVIFSVNQLFSQCLSSGLSEQPGVDLALWVADSDCLAGLVEQHNATSVLIDLGDARGAEVAQALSHSVPGLCLVALSVDDRVATDVMECARLGCCGIVPRDASLQDVTRIVRAAERGEVRMRPQVAAQLMRALADGEPSAPSGLPDCLTRREREICSLLAEGLTNKEIAREVNRSVGTVKNHVHSILSKLQLPRRGAIQPYLHKGVSVTPLRG